MFIQIFQLKNNNYFKLRLKRLSIHIFSCLFVSLFVTDKRQKGRTVQAQIFVGPHMIPGKVYGWKNCLKNSDFLKSTKKKDKRAIIRS